MTQQLREVQEAKTLMTEAIGWSVMKWLREKKTVRKIADRANAALDKLGERAKESWPEEFKLAYASIGVSEAASKTNGKKSSLHGAQSEYRLMAKKVKQADDDAYRARMDAEETFDRAEKQLSTRLAREGCEKAIRAWDLKEKAISKAETITVEK